MQNETLITGIGKALTCGPLISRDVPSLCNLMTKVKASFAGLKSQSIISAIVSDALVDNRIVVIVAKLEDDLVGFVIALVDSKVYWSNFIRRHPVLGTRVLVSKFLKIHWRPLNGQWKECSPSVAKILYISVLRDHRGKGIAEKLYHCLFSILRERGVRHIEAHIDFGNIPSVRLHEKVGWRIVETRSNFLASIDV